MRLRWRQWCAFLAEREPGTAVSLFRISIGICVVWMFGSVAAHGLVPVVWLNPADGGWRPVNTPWLLQQLGGVTPTNVRVFTILAIVSGLMLAIGLFGRLAAFLALQCTLALTHIDRPGFDDLLLGNLLWLLVLSRCTATLSLDCKLHTGSWRSAEPIPAWPRRLVIVQLVVMYFATGVQKATVYWTPADGWSALYYILQSPRWARAEKPWLADAYPLLQLGTAVTWLWEVTAPLLLFALWRRRRGGRGRFVWGFIAIGLMMHLGIFAFMDLGPFSFIALSCYWSLFRFGPVVKPTSAPRPSVVPVFVPLHILAVLLQAAPAPMYTDRAEWKHPQIQAEIARWAKHLGTSHDRLEDALWTASDRFVHVRDPIQDRFAPYYRHCGTSQGWRMFVAPDLDPTRLELEVFERGAWRCVYRELDPAHRWQAGILEHWRFRVSFFSTTWSRNWGEVQSFGEWLMPCAAADFPDATRFRLRLHTWRLLPAANVQAGESPTVRLLHERELSLK
ncbi:MAG: HTTM domain-containing protein [Gemmataceae bacterium]